MKRCYATVWFDRRTMEILIVGGNNLIDKAISECEKFSVIKRTSYFVAPMLEMRTLHAMTEVNIGSDRFLYVIGGKDLQMNAMTTMEILCVNDEEPKWNKLSVDLKKGL